MSGFGCPMGPEKYIDSNHNNSDNPNEVNNLKTNNPMQRS